MFNALIQLFYAESVILKNNIKIVKKSQDTGRKSVSSIYLFYKLSIN